MWRGHSCLRASARAGIPACPALHTLPLSLSTKHRDKMVLEQSHGHGAEAPEPLPPEGGTLARQILGILAPESIRSTPSIHSIHSTPPMWRGHSCLRARLWAGRNACPALHTRPFHFRQSVGTRWSWNRAMGTGLKPLNHFRLKAVLWQGKYLAF